MFRIALSLLSSLFLWSCVETNTSKLEKETLPYYNSSDFTPIFIKNEVEIMQKIPHYIADFTFFNQNGISISQQDIEGKIHVANFMFTTCGSICPSMTKNLRTVSKQFNRTDSVILLSFTVTPWVDSIAKLKSYKELYEIDNPNWHFLTGNTSEIYNLARQSYFAEEEIGFNKDSTDFLHTEHFLLVDENKRIRGIYNGTLQLEMLQLSKDIRNLKAAQIN